MTLRRSIRILSGSLLSSLILCAQAPSALAGNAVTPPADSLREGFRSPPTAARPRVWWHWMNGNVTKEGIRADMAWMKRVGIGGLQNFDVDLATGQIVDKRLVYMTPEWKDAFRFAAGEADRQGLELAIASSPGWSETGGPWVPPEDGLKKLVWSETIVSGPGKAAIVLPHPPSVTGPYQDLPKQLEISDLLAGQTAEQVSEFYRDVKVLALPTAAPEPLAPPRLTDGKGAAVANGAGAGAQEVRDARLSSVLAGPAELRLDYGRAVTVRSATLHIPGGAIPLLGALMTTRLQSSQFGTEWADVAPIPLDQAPTTIAFLPVTARFFRLVIAPLPKGGGDAAHAEAASNLAMDDAFGKGIGGLLARPITIGRFALGAEPTIDRFQAKAGFAIVPDYFALPSVGDGAAGPAPTAVIDLTDRMKADGTLDWNPPRGTWKVIRFGTSLLGKTNHPAPAEATGLEVDKYDRAAVERYLDHYLANYRDAAGSDLLGARGVKALLTDSIEIGAANWTPRLIEQFRRLRGYDPVPWMPVLSGTLVGTRAESDRFLFDYRRTLSDLMASEHYGTVAAVAHRNGLEVYGESLEGNRSSMGDDMAMRRYADYPMAAMWAFDAAKGPSPSYVVDVKGAASIAHLYGQNIVAAESMTAGMAPWAFGPADLKHIVDLEFVLGVNRPVIHTSVHVPVEDRKPGLSLAGIGQFFNRNESWAELATPWVDYLARNAFMLQQGRNVADIAYFYGEEAPLSGLFGHTGIPDAPVGHGYDFLNFDGLTGALAVSGNELVSSGGARYRAVYLGGSSRHMTLAALRKVAELVRGGATVIGTAPLGSPGLGDAADEYAALVGELWPGGAKAKVGTGLVIATADLAAGIREAGIAPDFAVTGASAGAAIPFAHRRLNDGDVYFLVNQSGRAQRIFAHFRVTGKAPELWHAETGEAEPVSYRIVDGETVVPLDLAPSGAVYVVFRKAAAAAAAEIPPAIVKSTIAIDGPWHVAFQPGRGAPASLTMSKLVPLERSADLGVRYFSGIATYTTTFASPRNWKPGQPLRLNLGSAHEVAEVTINGKPAGSAWHAPFTLDVGRYVRPGGRNRLQVRVANLWVNRLIRDADPAVTDKASWTSVPTWRPTAPLRPSGLIGPVILEATSH